MRSDKTARTNLPSIAFVGFGEAGQAFAAGLMSQSPGLVISAYDILTDDPATAESKRADYARTGVEGLDSTLAIQADVIFSTVTAEAALTAARSVSTAGLGGALFFDCNSCAPATKRQAAQVIDAAGGRYVDTAVMAPVHPARHRTAMLVSGEHSQAARRTLDALGMNARIAEGPVGTASTRKMVRSVMIKGMEALTLECFLAARRAGVETEVLASLEKSFPDFGWERQGGYNLERAMTHGLRRAAEMREVAKTVADLGLPSDMAAATALWQQRVGELGLMMDDADLFARADALLAALAGQAND